MKQLSIIPLALLSACLRSSDTFEVRGDGDKPVSAVVSVCGRTTPLRRAKDGQFADSVPITCEGDGVVRVGFADGASVNCTAGYVTDLHQDWSFIATKTDCRLEQKVR